MSLSHGGGASREFWPSGAILDDPSTIHAHVAGLIDPAKAASHNQSVHKRRNGAAAPEVRLFVSEGLLAGASFGEDATPSLHAIQEIAQEMTHDDSPAWTLEDATSQDVSAVLATLREVEKRSGGRIRWLTRRQAHLAAIYQAAGHDPWAAYVAAREYLALATRGEDLTEEALALARSTGEDLPPEQVDDLDVDYPAGMIDPFVKKVTSRS